MADFTPARGQDASPTIRGFLYQAQLTLLRWLDVESDETLVLECGEDIDRICRAAEPGEYHRKLEQVKARIKPITLRSPEVLCALANFAAHIVANPGQRLSFRYTTTAPVGRERLSSLGNRKGIEEWQSLIACSACNEEQHAIVSSIRQILSASQRPKGCRGDSWAALAGIVESEDPITLADFIRSVEWAPNEMSLNQVEAQILERIRTSVSGDGASKERHEHLLVFVFKTLATPGEKLLTAGMLEEELAHPTVTEGDRRRFSRIEEQLALHSDAIAQMQQQLSLGIKPLLLFGDSAEAIVEAGVTQQLPEAPALSTILAMRTRSVEDLKAKVTPGTWLSLHGEFGIGKSHLGRLIWESLDGSQLGVGMRDVPSDAASSALIALLGKLHSQLSEPTSPDCLFLDDLPDCSSQGRLGQVLTAFGHFAAQHQLKIISTGRHPLPTNVEASLANTLTQIRSPLFTDDETGELFRASGLPAEFLEPEWISRMNALCSGHPMLLTALARYTRDRHEEPSQVLFDALINAGHRKKLDHETALAVLESVEQAPCRKLLYRLALIRTPLSISEIRDVATVDPPLPEPSSCIAHLSGLWLRSTVDDRYEVSPLATALHTEVSESERAPLWLRVADIIFSRRRIGIAEFAAAQIALLGAGANDRAAFHLVNACMEWPHKAQGYGALNALLFFPPHDDQELSVMLELPVRAVQVITAIVENYDVAPYVKRLSALEISSSEQDKCGALMAGQLLLMSASELPMDLVCLGASLIEHHGRECIGTDALPDLDVPTEEFHIVMAMLRIRAWQDLQEFVSLVEGMLFVRQREIFDLPQLRDYMYGVVLRPLFDPDGDLTPDPLESLSSIEARARNMGWQVLAAHAFSGRLVVLSEYQDEIERTLDEASRALHDFSDDPIATAIVEATVGQQLIQHKRLAEGLRYLNRALESPDALTGIHRALRVADAMLAAWDAGTDPVPYADELERMLHSGVTQEPETLCQFNAQIAVVRWQSGSKLGAFERFEQAVLAFADVTDSARKEQFEAGLVHSLNYCVHLEEMGSPPATAADGGEYAEPRPHLFSGTRKEMAAWWRERQDPIYLPWMLGRMARALGSDDAADVWLDRALETARVRNNPSLLSLLLPRGVAAALRNGDAAGAIDGAVTHGRALVASMTTVSQGQEIIGEAATFDPSIPPTTTEDQSKAEVSTLDLLCTGIVLELGPKLATGDHDDLRSLVTAIDSMPDGNVLAESWAVLRRALELSIAESMSEGEYKEALALCTDKIALPAQIAVHGLLAMRPDARLEQAAVSQGSTLQVLEKNAKAMGISRDEYAHAIVEFWNRAVKQAPFRFSAPGVLRDALKAQSSGPPVAQAKQALRAVFAGLTIPGASQLREWLRSPD